MKIYLDKKNVYGKDLFYPSCNRSKQIAELKGSKTFTLLEALKLRDIGFEIKFKPVELTTLEDV